MPQSISFLKKLNLNDTHNLSLVDSPNISENEEPVYTDAFTKVKRPRDSYIVKSRSMFGRKNNYYVA